MTHTRAVVFRLLIVCLLLIVCGAVASLLPDRGTKQRRGAFREMTDRKMPPAITKHMKRLQAIPGLGGEQGPGSAEAEAFFAKAYPDLDIPLARLDAARAAGARLRGKQFPRAKAALERG